MPVSTPQQQRRQQQQQQYRYEIGPKPALAADASRPKPPQQRKVVTPSSKASFELWGLLLLLLCYVVAVAVVIGKECAVCVVHSVYTVQCVCCTERETRMKPPPPTAVLRSYKRQFYVVVNAETSPFGRLRATCGEHVY